ncbi:MAG TPA: response regulator [Bacillota bacterium]|nr:response regulator [Bacillota bacterium]
MNKEVILCVDDEKMVLQSIKNELINIFKHQYVVEVAESGPEALNLFNQLVSNHYEIPVVISDYIMPGMKGDEFLKKIHRLAPAAAKIMLTGQAVVEGIANAINEANLFRYLEKPWRKEELKAAIDDAFDNYHRDKALAVEQRQLLQTKETLQEELRRQNLELKFYQEKINTTRSSAPESVTAMGQLTENLLRFQEMPEILEKMKADLDALVHQGSAGLKEWPIWQEPPALPGNQSSNLDLGDYLISILGDLKKLAGDGVEISSACEAIPLSINDSGADARYLKYILLNLSTALIQGLNGSGKISLRTFLRDQQIVVRFEIWGKEEQLDSGAFFGDDFRANQSQNPELAFALSSSYRSIKELGGNVIFTKNASGIYTCEIILPVDLV